MYNQGSQFRIRGCFSLVKWTICFSIGQYRCTISELPLYIYIYIQFENHNKLLRVFKNINPSLLFLMWINP